MPGFDVHVKLEGGTVQDGLRGIIAGENIIQARKDLKTVGDKAVQSTALEVPVVLQKRGCIVFGSVGYQGVQVGTLLLAVPAERMSEQLGPARFRPAGHFVSRRETIPAVRLDDGIVLHLVAEGDGGKVAHQDALDGGVVPVFPISERHTQFDPRFRGEVLQGKLVKIHDLFRGRRIRLDGRLFGFVLPRFGAGRIVLPAGPGGHGKERNE